MRKATTICLKCVLTAALVLGIVACPFFCLTAGNALDAIWAIDGDDDV